MRSIVFWGVLLLALPSQSFINIEALRRAPGEGLIGSLNLQANGQTGNTDKFVGELASLNLFRQSEKEYLFLANYKYGESQKVRDVNQGSLHLRYAEGLNSFFKAELYAQSQFDQFRLLKLRNLVGTGGRFRLREGTKGGSYFGAGFFHEWEEIDLPDENQQDWRGNFYLSHLSELNEAWQASLIVYYQPAFQTFEDYRVRLDLGLESSITKTLSLTVKYSLNYDSEPPSTVLKTDTSYLAGIALRF